MPTNPRKRAIQVAQKKQRRGRLYVAIGLIAIVAVAIGWFAYASTLPPGPPDFSMTAPVGVTIHAGTPSSSIINITGINRFDGTVHLSATSSAGLSISINPVNVTASGTSVITISSQTNGTFSLTVAGTSGSLRHSVSPRVATPVYATLLTSNGTIYVELYRAQTPKTVANFVSLAQSHFYDNLVWHRIAQSPPVIQTGDPNTRYGNTSRTTWGTGGSSQTVPLEIDTTLHNNQGYLGMARGNDPNSGSSQFYVNMANNNYLDGNYTVFGKVIGPGSMNAANIIWHLPTTNTPQADLPVDTPFLLSVTITGM